MLFINNCQPQIGKLYLFLYQRMRPDRQRLITGSNVRLKLANMADRLLLRGDATTLLIVSAEEREGQRAQEAIDAFLTATGPVGAWMDRVANLP